MATKVAPPSAAVNAALIVTPGEGPHKLQAAQAMQTAQALQTPQALHCEINVVVGGTYIGNMISPFD